MNVWDQILTRVETKVNRHIFYTWFKPTSFVSEGTGAITVRVPSTDFKDWLTKHYSGVISEAMGEIEKTSLAINFIPDTQLDTVAIPLSPDEVTAAHLTGLDLGDHRSQCTLFHREPP